MPLVYLVPFGIEEHVLPSDLVALLARSAEEVEMHLGSPRLIQAPVAEGLIVHPFDAQQRVHGPSAGQRGAHDIDCLLVSQVGPIGDLVLLQQDQVPAIVATVERQRGAHYLKVPVFVNGEVHRPPPPVQRSSSVATRSGVHCNRWCTPGMGMSVGVQVPGRRFTFMKPAWHEDNYESKARASP